MSFGLCKKFVYVPLSVIVFKVLLSVNSKMSSTLSPGSIIIGVLVSDTIDYYNKQTKDLLLNRPLPGTAGESRLENVGEVENKGFEFTLNTVNIEKPDFLWSSSIQISSNKNKVVSLGDSDEIYLDTTAWNTADASDGGGTPSNTPVGMKSQFSSL